MTVCPYVRRFLVDVAAKKNAPQPRADELPEQNGRRAPHALVGLGARETKHDSPRLGREVIVFENVCIGVFVSEDVRGGPLLERLER